MDDQNLSMPDMSSIDIRSIPPSRQMPISEPLKQLLDQHLEQLKQSIERGVDELKEDFHKQVQSIHITIPSHSSGSSTIGTIWKSVRGQPDALEEENERLKEKFNRVKSQNTKLQKEIEDRRREISEITSDNERQRAKHEREQRSLNFQKLESGLGRQDQNMKSMKELEGKLSAAEQQNRMLVEQNGKFRSIILSRSSSSGEAIDDSKIVVPFISLRTQIQRIVFKFYKPNSAPRELQASATRRQQQFFDLWRDDFSDAQLLNRTRAMVFDLLNENILSSVCFGLDGFDSSENLESGLVNFEHALSSMWKGHESEISEWRTRSVKCAGLLRGEDTGTSPQRVAKLIWDFMAPIMPPAHMTAARNDLDDHLYRLCDSALNLTLLMRSCKDIFRCQILNDGDIFIDEDAVVQDSERLTSKRSEGSKIAFSISGVLVKYPEHKLGDRIVLEKAHVVIKD